jgi:hypothetical protein
MSNMRSSRMMVLPLVFAIGVLVPPVLRGDEVLDWNVVLQRALNVAGTRDLHSLAWPQSFIAQFSTQLTASSAAILRSMSREAHQGEHHAGQQRCKQRMQRS